MFERIGFKFRFLKKRGFSTVSYDKAREGDAEILIPTIVIAEIIWIIRKRNKHELALEVLDDLKEQENTKIISFSTEILDEMVKLKETHELMMK